MKRMIAALHINLKELPEQGESYQFDRVTGELNGILEDLIGTHDYKIDLQLRPMGNAFEITGEIETKQDLICTRCGRDLQYELKDRFQELFVIEPERPRAGHSGHAGIGDEGGVYCNYIHSPEVDLGEFVHEHIAANEPYTLLCGESDCADTLSRLNQQESPIAGVEKSSPFAVLKDLKLKS